MTGRYIFLTDEPTQLTLRHDNGLLFPGLDGTAAGRSALIATIDQDVPDGHGAAVRLDREKYTVIMHGVLRSTLNPVTGSLGFDVDTVDVQVKGGARPFDPERDRLEVNGTRFWNQGRVWAHRGASMFPLPARFKAGEDISPQIRWMQKHGVSTARVFPNWIVEWTRGPNKQFDDPAHIAVLDAFAATLADAGLRVQFSLVTEKDLPLDYWRRALQGLYDIGASRWNVTVETHNEPWVQTSPALAPLIAGIDRHGVLSSTGILARGAVPDGFEPVPPSDHLDFGTHRTGRDQYFPKNGKDLEDLRSTTRIPWIDDEPMGIVDVIVRGGRTNDDTAVLSHFAEAMFYGGATIHTQAGIAGLTPEQTGEPITEDICEGITALWQFIAPEAQLGGYINVGRERFGILYEPNDSLINRAYGSWDGTTLYVVVPVPKPGWAPKIAPGWRLLETCAAAPYVMKLARS